MSETYTRMRTRAVEIAVQQLGRHVRETNNHLHDVTVPLENRGPVVDEYLRLGGVGTGTMNATGSRAADDRQWCGMFVYYCYYTAGQQLGVPLPFQNTDLWAGGRLRIWARRQEEQTLSSGRIIIWSNAFSAHNATGLQILPGDIFSIGDGHIGIASGPSVGDSFETIEGNQSDLGSSWEGIARKHRRITDCSIIVRI